MSLRILDIIISLTVEFYRVNKNNHLSFRLYSTLYKSEIRDLYEKYRLDFELFGYQPDEFIKFGMEDETSSI